MPVQIQLEPAVQQFVKSTSTPPFLHELDPGKGRSVVDEVQSGPIAKPDVDIEERTISGPKGEVGIKILRPPGETGTLPAILYIHGAGWVFGNAHTHDRLIRELAVGARACVVFPNYSLSPEAKYPTAIEECYAVLQWVADNGRAHGLDPERIVVAGDSVGGNMAIAMTLMSKKRSGPAIHGQLLLYPVTDASFDTESYEQFASGYFLRRDAMMWFWDQYTMDPNDRAAITASPLRASTEQLRGLPPAMVITAEADVLRDHAETYANKLREADVSVAAVRFQGTIHDFMMLNALAETCATRTAVMLATAWLRTSLQNQRPG